MIYIGIDTGVHTGIAYWDSETQSFDLIKTVKIHEAMAMVKAGIELSKNGIYQPIKVVFEDARQRKWFGNAGREQLQGAGSIKRDCSIWEDFLKSLKADFEMVAPKDNRTKLNAQFFAKITGWKERTSEHSRDAAMLVFGRK